MSKSDDQIVQLLMLDCFADCHDPNIQGAL